MRANEDPKPTAVTVVKVTVDDYLLAIYGGATTNVPMGMERAAEEAISSDAQAAEVGGVVVVQTPQRRHLDVPVRMERWSTEPPGDMSGWDYVAEAGVSSNGRVISLAGGRKGGRPVRVVVPDGRYRALIAARLYLVSREVLAFRVQLWRGDRDGVRVIKRW